MKPLYFCPGQSVAILLLLAVSGRGLAQAPRITGLSPLANAPAAPRTAPVTASFNQPLTAGSAGALRVFSSERGGLRSRGASVAVVSGNTATFVPVPYPWMPGETVVYTVTTGAAGSSGNLAQGRVGQFTAAVTGTGTGSFVAGGTLNVTGRPSCVAAADVDGDGDLDLLTTGGFGTSSLTLLVNNGSGAFGNGRLIGVGGFPSGVATGDLDADGDLDFVAANMTNASTAVSVRLNDGAGLFSGSQEVRVGSGPVSVALADVDADGDLDLLAANFFGNTVSVRFNDGSGGFSGAQDVSVGDHPNKVATGDVDGDGDLDLLTANYSSVFNNQSDVSVRLNDGSGVFSGTQQVAVGSGPGTLAADIALGDVDGDGDLDLVTSDMSAAGGTASVRVNNGSGAFSGTQNVRVGGSAYSVVLGDVDGDGDLDLVAPSSTGSNGAVSIRLNDGTGVFASGPAVSVGSYPNGVALADLDGDGDVDLVTANDGTSTGTVSVRFNQLGLSVSPAAAASGQPLALAPNPSRAAGVVAVTGLPARARVHVFDVLGRAVAVATADAAGAARLELPVGLAPGLYGVRGGGRAARLVVE